MRRNQSEEVLYLLNEFMGFHNYNTSEINSLLFGTCLTSSEREGIKLIKLLGVGLSSIVILIQMASKIKYAVKIVVFDNKYNKPYLIPIKYYDPRKKRYRSKDVETIPRAIFYRSLYMHGYIRDLYNRNRNIQKLFYVPDITLPRITNKSITSSCSKDNMNNYYGVYIMENIEVSPKMKKVGADPFRNLECTKAATIRTMVHRIKYISTIIREFHKNKIIHGDLHYYNIIWNTINSKSIPVVIDFGRSLLLNDQPNDETRTLLCIYDYLISFELITRNFLKKDEQDIIDENYIKYYDLLWSSFFDSKSTIPLLKLYYTKLKKMIDDETILKFKNKFEYILNYSTGHKVADKFLDIIDMKIFHYENRKMNFVTYVETYA